MEQGEETWSSNANEALDVWIVQPGETAPSTLSTFHPRFTYPIFGDEETIFGYRGLKIILRFAAHDLYPHVEAVYDRKFKNVGETKALDIEETLREWYPPYAFGELLQFNIRVQDDTSAKSWGPPGDLIESYVRHNRQFEIWCAELTDPAVKILLERMQIFVSLFIEAGTPLELNDQEWTLARWRVFFVYEKLKIPSTVRASPYSIVGYSTSYRFITFQGDKFAKEKPPPSFTLPFEKTASIASLPCRARISQFLILPSHQANSHGAHLYNAMVKTFVGDPACIEITVEDPSEAFDDLRDICDMAILQQDGTLARIKLETNIDPIRARKRIGVKVPSSVLLDKPLLEYFRKRHKLAPRQFDRLAEMHLLSQIPQRCRSATPGQLVRRGETKDLGLRAYYFWKLLVKQRVYKRNKDTLMQLEREERIDKVEETVASVQADYDRLWDRMAKLLPSKETDGGTTRESDVALRQRNKRRAIIEDEEEESHEGQKERSTGKKRKGKPPLVDGQG